MKLFLLVIGILFLILDQRINITEYFWAWKKNSTDWTIYILKKVTDIITKDNYISEHFGTCTLHKRLVN